MDSENKKRLVLLGVKRKGERGFRVKSEKTKDGKDYSSRVRDGKELGSQTGIKG